MEGQNSDQYAVSWAGVCEALRVILGVQRGDNISQKMRNAADHSSRAQRSARASGCVQLGVTQGGSSIQPYSSIPSDNAHCNSGYTQESHRDMCLRGRRGKCWSAAEPWPWVSSTRHG